MFSKISRRRESTTVIIWAGNCREITGDRCRTRRRETWDFLKKILPILRKPCGKMSLWADCGWDIAWCGWACGNLRAFLLCAEYPFLANGTCSQTYGKKQGIISFAKQASQVAVTSFWRWIRVFYDLVQATICSASTTVAFSAFFSRSQSRL